MQVHSHGLHLHFHPLWGIPPGLSAEVYIRVGTCYHTFGKPLGVLAEHS